MLSVLYCGDYAGVDEAWLPLGREVKARELPPTGAPRILIHSLLAIPKYVTIKKEAYREEDCP